MKRLSIRRNFASIILSLVAVWSFAIGIAFITGLVMAGSRGEWHGDWAWIAVGRFGRGIACAYVGWLMYENRRLRETPLWKAADAQFTNGYSRGYRDGQTDVRRRAA